MSFVLIAEPEEVNAARIKAILDGVDTSFTYELVDSAEKVIDVIEKRKPDVFIGDMQMPVISGTELFSMLEMLSPETVRIVMTDGGNISETVAFINECRIDKIILKPCRVADDLLTPIGRALSYKETKEFASDRLQAAGMEQNPEMAHYERMERVWKEKTDIYKKKQIIFEEMLRCNLEGKGLSDAVKERLGRWYQWMAEEYVRGIFTGSGDYEATVRMLTSFGHDPGHGCTFAMKRNFDAPVQPMQMNEIAYMIKVLTGTCRDLLRAYRIAVLLEQAEKFYILRVCVQVERDANGNAPESAFRVRTPELRRLLAHATELGLQAFGYQSTRTIRGAQEIVSIAIPK